MSEGWLTPQSARPKAEAKLTELYDAARKRRSTTTDLEGVARALSSINAAASDLASSYFTHSVGVTFASSPNEHETWYICGSKAVGGYFAQHSVIPWTHWLAKVATQLRQAFDRGELPATLIYGPPGKERELPVGPLVDYFIADGRI